MKERPILFSAPMVRALLAGTKTQTRRAINPQPTRVADGLPYGDGPAWSHAEPGSALMRSAYGVPGDRLWVREAWRVGKPHDHRSPSAVVERMGQHETLGPRGVTVLYEAGGWKSVGPAGRDEPVYPDDEPMPNWAGKGRPSIHMPRAFSRITLEVTDVRVERLQDISQADAIAEGAPPSHRSIDRISREYGFADFSRSWYGQLWESINGAGSWDANPWAWVVGFKVVSR